MKKLIVFIVMLFVATLCISAAQPYEYILPTEFERIEYAEVYDTVYLIIATDKDGNVAAYDFNGEKKTDDYDALHFYNNGMGVARRDDKVYVINYQGNELGEFGDDFIALTGPYVLVDKGGNDDGRPVSYYQGEFAVCNYDGTVLKTYPYDGFLPNLTAGYGLTFEGGRLIFEKDGKFGAINHNFEVVVEPIYDKIYGFKEDHYTAVAIKDGKHGIIDYDGNVLTAFEYDYIEPLYENDSLGCFKAQKDDKQGVIAADGKTVLMPLSDCKIDLVYTGYALAQIYEKSTREDAAEYANLYGLVDFSGNIVLPTEHISIDGISEGIIAAKKSYDHAGYYDLFGNEITPFKYRMISEFSGGYAFASSCIDNVWTHEVIDKEGNVVFNPENFANGFQNGIAYVDGKFIDTNGDTVFEITDKKAVLEKEGAYTVTNGEHYGVIKYVPEKEEALFDFEYIDFYGEVSKISKLGDGYAFMMKDGTYRYFDKAGKETDNEVLVYGWNVFYKGDTLELRDNNNKVIATVNNADVKHISETADAIAVLYSEGVKIYSKDSGEELQTLNLAVDEFYLGESGSYYYKEDGKYFIGEFERAYDLVWFLGENFSAKRNGGWYIVSQSGKELNQTPFENAPSLYLGCDKYYFVEGENGVKLIDMELNLVSTLDVTAVNGIYEDKFIVARKSDMTGVIDINGKEVIPFSSSNIEYLGDGLFDVNLGGMHSVVNSDGRTVAANCNYITVLGDNGYIGISQSDFEGYIDKNGRVMITLPSGYYVQGAFSEGLASVVENIMYSRYGDVSYINENGEFVIYGDDAWCYGGEFENGIAAVGTKLGKAGPQSMCLVSCLYDTPSDWAIETVEEAINKGILDEAHQKRYRRNITREDFCEIVYELEAVQAAAKNKSLDGVSFTDTVNEKVRALSAIGIIFGVGNGEFNPDAFITREEVATILARVYALDKEMPAAEEFVYADDALIADWAKESVYKMRAAGIMLGVDGGKFSPETMCTTEQTVAAAMRLAK